MDTKNTDILSKTLILAVETSGRTGSVALARGQQQLAQIDFSGMLRHSAELFPAIYDLLRRFGQKPEDIEHIYLSIGPGSFTGLRIAATFAKTMHLTNAVKIVVIDTLDVIAANVNGYEKEKPEQIATILDAKRGQFFIALYQNEQDQWVKSVPDCLMTASEFTAKYGGKTKPLWLLGEGLVYYKDRFAVEGIQFFDEKYWYPKAGKVHLIGWQKALSGQFAEPLTLQPSYLRRPEAEENLQKTNTKPVK